MKGRFIKLYFGDNLEILIVGAISESRLLITDNRQLTMNKLYFGDNLEILRELDDERVHLICTNP